MSMEIPYNMFQFYDSAIKSTQVEEIEMCLYGFNSTIVRLKDCKPYSFNTNFYCFNSTIVRLKVGIG